MDSTLHEEAGRRPIGRPTQNVFACVFFLFSHRFFFRFRSSLPSSLRALSCAMARVFGLEVFRPVHLADSYHFPVSFSCNLVVLSDGRVAEGLLPFLFWAFTFCFQSLPWGLSETE